MPARRVTLVDAVNVDDKRKLPPAKAVRRECLNCMGGHGLSAQHVRECERLSCPFWPHRMGRKPTAADLAKVADVLLDPPEIGKSGRDVAGRSALKAVPDYCLECAGGCKQAVIDCKFTDCWVYPYRFGKNPQNLTEEQRARKREHGRRHSANLRPFKRQEAAE